MRVFSVVSGLVILGLMMLGPGAPDVAAQEAPGLARLNSSPRHHEWVEIDAPDRTVHAFVVFPQVSQKVPVIIVVHENRGLTDWVRGLADQVAEAGYIAVAPDFLSGMGPGGGKTSDFSDRNAARDVLYELTQEQLTADLHAVADHAQAIPAANGTIAVAGFCWGGRQAFHFATQRDDLAAAFPFYGTAPAEDELLSRIGCPVYGFYGGDDERVTSTVEATIERMKTAGKAYDPAVYEGAGHGFMRSGETAEASEANRRGRDDAWRRWEELLAELGSGTDR